MALAQLKCLKCTGTNAATETDCNKTPTFLSVDAVDADPLSNPISAPLDAGSSPTYSMENVLRWELTSAPDNYIESLKAFGPSLQPDWDAPTPNKMTVNWGTTQSPTTPTSNASSIATTSQHDNYYSAATGLSIPLVPGDNRLDAVGEKTYYLYSQLQLDFGVNQGLMNPQVWNLDWLEL